MNSGLMNAARRSGALLLLGMLAFAGCEREKRNPRPTPPPEESSPASLVLFPPEVQADDPAVNAFIRKAINICVTKDETGKPNYDAFRLLWSALEEPLGEQEFLRGFAATQKVTILDVMKRRTADDEIVYLVHCLVELDPEQVPEPTRDIVMLLRKENGQWRVATPPRKEVQALKARYAHERQESAITSNGVDSPDASTS